MYFYILLAGILATSATGAFVLVRLNRRMQSTMCPKCQRSVPIAVVERDGLCPFCAEASPPSAGVPEPGAPHCGRCGNVHALHTLWDGNLYCDSCINLGADETRLFDNPFVERLHLPWHRAFVRHLSELSALWAIGVACLGILAFFLSSNVPTALKAASLFAGIGGVIATIFAAGRTLLCVVTPAEVLVARGWISVIDGTSAYGVSIRDCHWHDGRLGQSSFGNVPRSEKSPCIILSAERDATDGKNAPMQIPVGTTPESRKLWNHFIRIVSLPPLQ